MSRVDVLQRLNSLFSTGELPTLFSSDEMNGILQVLLIHNTHTTHTQHMCTHTHAHALYLSSQALGPSIKKDFATEDTHPMQYFTARIARYLRIVICISPSSPLLTSQAQ